VAGRTPYKNIALLGYRIPDWAEMGLATSRPRGRRHLTSGGRSDRQRTVYGIISIGVNVPVLHKGNYGYPSLLLSGPSPLPPLPGSPIPSPVVFIFSIICIISNVPVYGNVIIVPNNSICAILANGAG
jgi:hypothetical protein